MGSKPVRINLKILNELTERYSSEIENEHGIKPNDSQLIQIMFHHWQGREVEVRRKKKCLIINYI